VASHSSQYQRFGDPMAMHYIIAYLLNADDSAAAGGNIHEVKQWCMD